MVVSRCQSVGVHTYVRFRWVYLGRGWYGCFLFRFQLYFIMFIVLLRDLSKLSYCNSAIEDPRTKRGLSHKKLSVSFCYRALISLLSLKVSYDVQSIRRRHWKTKHKCANYTHGHNVFAIFSVCTPMWLGPLLVLGSSSVVIFLVTPLIVMTMMTTMIALMHLYNNFNAISNFWNVF